VKITHIKKRKRPAATHVWPVVELGEDYYGRWFFCPVGSTFRGEKNGVVGYTQVAQGNRDTGRALLTLIPPGGWWVASCADGEVCAEICTPAELVDGVWTYIDLELDPYRDEAGGVRVDDWDEFEDACRLGFIPADEERAARSAADEVEDLLQRRVEPFDQVGVQRLADAVDLDSGPTHGTATALDSRRRYGAQAGSAIRDVRDCD
jgi:uncharacterized protein DUF402